MAMGTRILALPVFDPSGPGPEKHARINAKLQKASNPEKTLPTLNTPTPSLVTLVVHQRSPFERGLSEVLPSCPPQRSPKP